MGEIGKFNRLYRQMDATEKELRRRGREARLALLRLYDHPNMQVRLNAAKRTLGIAPDAARRVLQAISDSKWQPQAMMPECHSGISIEECSSQIDGGIPVLRRARKRRSMRAD